MARNTIIGSQRLISQLKSFGIEGQQIVSAEIEATALNIELEAKNKAPVDLGKLRQSIGTERITTLTYKIFANVNYAPYVEFGTGAKVSIPPNWGDLASYYKGKGIRQVNINPQPFLYPAFVNGKKYLKENMTNSLNELIRRSN